MKKIEHELAGDRLEQMSLMTESHAVACRKGARLKQGILHAGDLFLHGLKRLPYHGRPYFAGTQIANFLDLQKIKKGILLRGGYQSGFFPTRQLTRREPKYAKQVRSSISVHGFKWTSSVLSESPPRRARRK
jgi:hypothetical protein